MSYPDLRDEGIPQKWLKNNSKILFSIIAISVNKLLDLSLEEIIRIVVMTEETIF